MLCFVAWPDQIYLNTGEKKMSNGKRDESRISREEEIRMSRNSGKYHRLPHPGPGFADEILEFYKPKGDDHSADGRTESSSNGKSAE